MFENETPPQPTPETPATKEGAPQTFSQVEEQLEDPDFGKTAGLDEAAKNPQEEEEEDFGDDEEIEDAPSEGEEEEFAEDEPDEEDSEEEDLEEEPDDEKVFLEQKVDGKVHKFTEKQVRNIIASGFHTIQKANEVAAFREKTFQEINQKQSLINEIDQKITPVWDAVKKKDYIEAVSLLTSEEGMDKLKARRALLSQVAPIIIDRLGLTSEQATELLRRNADRNKMLSLEEERAWEAEKSQRLQESLKPRPETPDQVALKGLSHVRMQHGIGDQELNRVLDFIENESGADSAISPEEIVKVTLMMRTVDKAVAAVKAVKPSLVSDRKFLDSVRVKAQKNPEWTLDKLARWVDKAAREKADKDRTRTTNELQKDISRKALKGGKSSFENPGAAQKPQRFEDIDVESFGKLA